ncbi:sodium ion-translocating decarboxylase subunit beta [Tetragenococcus muriaticus]|uniref:Oxaloacetate decarboxylase beta subunit n=2 Tax=Tetragenococcus muriaticus TaxID=64642 RepID=A0A091C0L1_9ENTE|nr:sodium ion-translocating decarboxylase subunit beta [Tetragenococcus muriaticus]KFN91361.1 oxaloacetate decarboxylase beta subunit [Tetragenococcus muriaticus 3MR10-3]KFN91814.1 oxaloacetate decarboxylase beta subunit [Tetragenococcus muriaticus PMC-11-5]GMA47313.1 putative methylmalonyl-CoA decarboxylase, beta-subunit [Tetragenococcus muriaticus]
MFDVVNELVQNSGILSMTYKELIMIIISLIFLYLAVRKGYEPYLLIPIAFGILLVNLPLAGLVDPPANGENGGLLYYLYQGVDLGIYPPLIFLCLGASTDFGPLLANPKTLLLGGAAQFGIFSAFFLAIVAGMSPEEAASIGIIGGADGPTAIYLSSQLADHILPAIALAAYSYMALVPIIQPPLMRLFTNEKERKVKMEQLRTVSKKEKVLFPIVTTLFVTLIIPSATTLVGMLMLGNIIRESGQVPKLTETLQNSFMYIVTILLGVSVGSKATGDTFLTWSTLIITVLGLAAFAVGTISGLLLGKVMYKLTNGQINPLIGAAGVSAVPMASRVVQKEGVKYNPSNYLLMHAMSPNVAGVVGSAVTAGVLLSFFG